MKTTTWLSVLVMFSGAFAASASAEEPGLIGHWKLAGNAQDSSGHGQHAVNHGVDFSAPGPSNRPGGAARFDGKKAHLVVAPSKFLRLGQGDFSLAVWVHTAAELDDVLGDLVSKYDPETSRGLTWSIKNSAGVTSSQSNYRNVHFGIDNGQGATPWRDCGRPGKSVFVKALAVYDGQLYAGICEPDKDDAGHLYRFDGGTQWTDCGSPDPCNAVTALAVYDGKLYAGVGRYRLRGSLLPESTNPHVGGKVFRYEGARKWTPCGQLPGMESVGGMVVFRGQLYVSSQYKPCGFYRYEGGTTWVACAIPQEERRVGALCVYNGYLYATTYDDCGVYRYDGKTWTSLGELEPKGQSYSFEIHNGDLYVGTWPNGKVFRYGGDKNWVDVGRLGEEREVMGMAVYNGKLYAGTLPLAEVYRYEGGTAWKRTGQLDQTPDVRYRRAWSMAVFQGRLFCGTLPSGHVYSLEAGKCVSYDRELGAGWKHLAAVRQGDRLKLYVSGKLVATSSSFDPVSYDLTNDQPLKIGFGAHDYFQGLLSDLRLYERALTPAEIASLAVSPAGK